jgi:chromate transporter
MIVLLFQLSAALAGAWGWSAVLEQGARGGKRDPALDRGMLGAAVCALAIFLPSFVIVALIGPLMPWLRSSATLRAFLDGVNAAVVGTIAATSWSLFRAAAIDLPGGVANVPIAGIRLDLFAAVLTLGAGALLLPRRAPNSTLLIAAGAGLGLIAQALAGRL